MSFRCRGLVAAVMSVVIGGRFVDAVPVAPVLSAPVIAAGSVTLAWTLPPGASGVRLEAGTAAGASNAANAVMGAVTTYTAPNVPPGTYYVRVRAIDASGESAASNEVVVQVGGSGLCTAPPNAPSGLVASAAGSAVNLSWSAAPTGCPAGSFTLEAGSAPGASNLATVPTPSPSFTATAPAGTYYFRVRAANAFGTSAPSNEVVLTVGGSPPGPTAPGSFGPGQWRIGANIAAGRYYSVPKSGCYWERQKGFSGTLTDVLSNEFIGYNALQWIVDILLTDVAFETDADCGTWYTTPRYGAQTTIPPGVWLIGAQIAPGTYRSTAASGCYWARLRDFTSNLDGIIANEFVSSAGQRLVTIAATDVGFENDADCGTWVRVSSISALDSEPVSVDEIRWNRAAYRQHRSEREPKPLVP